MLLPSRNSVRTATGKNLKRNLKSLGNKAGAKYRGCTFRFTLILRRAPAQLRTDPGNLTRHRSHSALRTLSSLRFRTSTTATVRERHFEVLSPQLARWPVRLCPSASNRCLDKYRCSLPRQPTRLTSLYVQLDDRASKIKDRQSTAQRRTLLSSTSQGCPRHDA